jgi:hypothetical protein
MTQTTLEHQCQICLYRQPSWRDGGHCYMFRDKPDFAVCLKVLYPPTRIVEPSFSGESAKHLQMEALCRDAFTKYGRYLHRTGPETFAASAETATKVCEWYNGDIGFVWNDDLSMFKK